MPENEEKKIIAGLVDAWIKDEIDEIALKEKRTASNVVGILLEKAIRARKKNEPLVVNQ